MHSQEVFPDRQIRQSAGFPAGVMIVLFSVYGPHRRALMGVT